LCVPLSNAWHNRAAAVDAPFQNALSAAPRSSHGHTRHGRDGCGMKVPCTSREAFRCQHAK
jgi:hypothetical protein